LGLSRGCNFFFLLLFLFADLYRIENIGHFSSKKEDRGHLFFSYGFSGRIWKNVMGICGVRVESTHLLSWGYVLYVLNPPTCWDDVVSLGLHEWKGKTIKAYICRLVFDSSIYNIWRIRNALRHSNNP